MFFLTENCCSVKLKIQELMLDFSPTFVLSNANNREPNIPESTLVCDHQSYTKSEHSPIMPV